MVKPSVRSLASLLVISAVTAVASRIPRDSPVAPQGSTGILTLGGVPASESGGASPASGQPAAGATATSGASGSGGGSSNPSSSSGGGSSDPSSGSDGGSSGPSGPSSGSDGGSSGPSSESNGGSASNPAPITGVPNQTAAPTATVPFEVETLSSITGPPGSYSQTTSYGSDHKTTIYPIWFGPDGVAVGNFPKCAPCPLNGRPPTPPGLGPPLVIGPDGTSKPVQEDGSGSNPDDPDSNSDDPQSTGNPSSISSDSASDSASASTTGTTTSSASTTSSSTSPPSAVSSVYLLVPQDNASQSDKLKVKNDLIEQNGKDNVGSFPDDSTSEIEFLAAQLNETQRLHLQGGDIINWIVPNYILELDLDQSSSNTSSGAARRRAARRSNTNEAVFEKRAEPPQRNADWSLGTISEQRIKNVVDTPPAGPNAYDYNDDAGSAATVYVIDTGATLEAPEYSNAAVPIRWMFPKVMAPLRKGLEPRDDPKEEIKDDWGDPNEEGAGKGDGHGTCVLSKVNGPMYGVAKKVKAVVVKLEAFKLQKKNEEGVTIEVDSATAGSMLAAYTAVRLDIEKKSIAGKAVVSVASGIKLGLVDEQTESMLEDEVGRITAMGVPVVAAVGQSQLFGEPTHQPVQEFPATAAQENQGIIAVAGSEQDGYPFLLNKEATWVKLFAPGAGVECANRRSDKSYHSTEDGTSVATGAVAGLAAYEISLAQQDDSHPLHSFQASTFAKNVHDYLYSLAWARVSGGPAIISNQPLDCTSNTKRDGKEACAAVSSNTASASTTSASFACPTNQDCKHCPDGKGSGDGSEGGPPNNCGPPSETVAGSRLVYDCKCGGDPCAETTCKVTYCLVGDPNDCHEGQPDSEWK